MRRINRIIWHCAATPEGSPRTVEDIRGYHTRPKAQGGRGWSDIGYHYVIELDGAVREGRPLHRIGAHVKNHNRDSIGICYVGGMTADMSAPKDTRTPLQRRALYRLTEELLERFPGATVHGHNEFAAKACPCFDARADWAAHAGGDGEGDLVDPEEDDDPATPAADPAAPVGGVEPAPAKPLAPRRPARAETRPAAPAASSAGARKPAIAGLERPSRLRPLAPSASPLIAPGRLGEAPSSWGAPERAR